jgi:hypothetical protein
MTDDGILGTPVSGGGAVPGVSALAQQTPYTLLSLDRYAKIMGINPVHFYGANIPTDPVVLPVHSTCSSLWTKYSWQDADKVSRSDIADEILLAESEIARMLGYYPAPVWIENDTKPYPRPFFRDHYGVGLDVRGDIKSVDCSFGRVIAAGRRAVSLIDTVATGGGGLVYSDEDGDGFYETATISIETTLTDINEIKVYFTGYDGQINWEIREPRRKYISSGYAYFTFDSWKFIEPYLFEQFQTDEGFTAIDISDTSNFVSQADVYREYTDYTQTSAQFKWENEGVFCANCSGEGCEACGNVSQNGCLRVRDGHNGILVPVPASYDEDDDEWTKQAWSASREPDKVTMWYCAGEQSKEYLNGTSVSPLSEFWAKTIAMLATARLDRPLCECGNVNAVVEKLQVDTSRNTVEGTFFNPPSIIDNPFGPRVGEMLAWRRMKYLSQRKMGVAVVS